jgi:hypothetical protein
MRVIENTEKRRTWSQQSERKERSRVPQSESWALVAHCTLFLEWRLVFRKRSVVVHSDRDRDTERR